MLSPDYRSGKWNAESPLLLSTVKALAEFTTYFFHYKRIQPLPLPLPLGLQDPPKYGFWVMLSPGSSTQFMHKTLDLPIFGEHTTNGAKR